MKLSVIIPSFKDPCLFKTINSIVKSFKTEYEIIPVLDGYIPESPIEESEIIRPLYLKENVGMREAINRGIDVSTGEYIMRTDEHCLFDDGFDRKMIAAIQENWIMTARRYKLDINTWERMERHGFIDYEKLIIKEATDYRKFSGVQWRSREKERKEIAVDETMAMQGSCWIMARSWWNDVIVRLETEGYGPLYQDSTEMVFKTWMAKGKLMINKNTWFAHKHRSFNRTHHYPTSRAKPEWKYALEMWEKEYERIKNLWAL